MFDGLRLSRASSLTTEPAAADRTLARAVERVARATGAISQAQEKGAPVLEHQKVALEQARTALDQVQPNASRDMSAAIERNPGLAREAASGRSGPMLAAMAQEARLRADLRRLAGSVRQAKEQMRWLLISGVVGLALGLLLYAALAGPIARMMPASWHWPERMAARMLGKDTIWNAGQHLMASVSQPSWDAIADAANLVRNNSETIERCRKAAGKAKKAVRCTIEVKGE